MKKILSIILLGFALQSSATSLIEVKKIEIRNNNSDVPKEVVDALTKIVLEFERTGQVPQCNECGATCRITSRVSDGKCIVYRFECESGNSYWATYTNGQVHVTSAIVNENGNVYFPLCYPCMD